MQPSDFIMIIQTLGSTSSDRMDKETSTKIISEAWEMLKQKEMKDQNVVLSLSKDRLDEIVSKAAEFTTEPTVEQDIAELVEAKKEIEIALKKVQAAFKDKFATGEMENSIEGDIIRVSISQSGSIYKLVDASIVDPHLLKLQLNSDAVAAYVEENELIPEGVEYNNARSLSARITVK